jgi:hypothetical protein
MYKIIGGDQKEYGPVSAEQIRQWIAEGRANGQTLVLPQGATEWRPLSALPEFAVLVGTLAPSPPPFGPGGPGADAAPPTPDEILARDYDVDIGRCVVRSWELVKQNFWPTVGVTTLVAVVEMALNQVISLIYRSSMNAMIYEHHFTAEGAVLIVLAWLVGLPVQTVLTGGLYYYYLRLIRGQNPGFADAFYGVTGEFVQLALLGIAIGILVVLGVCACVIPGIYLSVAWVFAMPLVVDRQMGFWQAMVFSMKVVNKHWFTVFALMIVVGLLSAAGIIACCIGVFVTMTIGWGALMYAYEDIFGRQSR